MGGGGDHLLQKPQEGDGESASAEAASEKHARQPPDEVNFQFLQVRLRCQRGGLEPFEGFGETAKHGLMFDYGHS